MILFLDVDGTLLPFGGPGPYPEFEAPLPAALAGNPLLARVDPALGPRLAGLGCELVWATTWLDDANTCLAPRLGLPALPTVDWPEDREPPDGLHWKTLPLTDWAAGEPFVWVDDEIRAADRDWVAARYPGPALLHRVDHRAGLTGADFDALERWITTYGISGPAEATGP
ncbi:HAD domain-containing protein [Streptomyces sp. NPDC000983]|uniref:HAD domain-containing protein n=1 Tax=Streptomyces sp. NPDC000983 TaxID=3154373 RepID=UPI003331EA57